MPRIYTSTNDPLDFCHNCFPDYAWAEELYGNVGSGPDDRGNCFDYDADHPSYDEMEYSCCECHAPLTGSDDCADWADCQ